MVLKLLLIQTSAKLRSTPVTAELATNCLVSINLFHAIYCLSFLFLSVTPSFPPKEEQNQTFRCLSPFIMGTNSSLCWQRSYYCQWELCTL